MTEPETNQTKLGFPHEDQPNPVPGRATDIRGVQERQGYPHEDQPNPHGRAGTPQDLTQGLRGYVHGSSANSAQNDPTTSSAPPGVEDDHQMGPYPVGGTPRFTRLHPGDTAQTESSLGESQGDTLGVDGGSGGATLPKSGGIGRSQVPSDGGAGAD